jgi:hypothetical protein
MLCSSVNLRPCRRARCEQCVGHSIRYSLRGNCTVATNPAAFNGVHQLTLTPGCAAVNRGLVAAPTASSIHWVGGKDYDGYLFYAPTIDSTTATIRVSLLCAELGDFAAKVQCSYNCQLLIWRVSRGLSVVQSFHCKVVVDTRALYFPQWFART